MEEEKLLAIGQVVADALEKLQAFNVPQAEASGVAVLSGTEADL